MCCNTVRDVTERSVTAMCTICQSSGKKVNWGGFDQPRLSVVPSCILRSHIHITVFGFVQNDYRFFLKDNPQSRHWQVIRKGIHVVPEEKIQGFLSEEHGGAYAPHSSKYCVLVMSPKEMTIQPLQP
ncbi:hypothetical protein TNCV_5097091 [Trichonephila clavipes]|nr:hypothetical protein TNCV_5097091 [Trichonephila clavipes]